MVKAITASILLALQATAVDFFYDLSQASWTGGPTNFFAVFGAWTPLSIPGCAVWFDAADAASMTLDGTNVTVWADKSGNGRDAAMFALDSAPAYAASTQNGLGGVWFHGAAAAKRLDFACPVAARHTLFMVMRSTDDARAYSAPFAYDRYSTDRGAPFFIKQSSRKSASYPLYDSGYWDGSGAQTYAVGETCVFSFRMGQTGDTVEGWKNGNLDASFTSTANNVATNLMFGASNDGQQWVGCLLEFVIYDSRLSDADIDAAETALMSKWGVTP